MSEPGAAGARGKLRIENLSDLVFGLALSIGSIILIARLPETPADLVSSVVLFGFSFLIVIWIWSGYTRTMAILPTEVRGAFALNVVLLFCVAIEPYLYDVLQQSSSSFIVFTSSAYAVDTGAMMFTLAGLIFVALREEGSRTAKRIPAELTKRLKMSMVAEIFSGALFLVSTLPIFWVSDPFGSYLRFDLWYASFIGFFVLLLTRREVQKGPPTTPSAGLGQ